MNTTTATASEPVLKNLDQLIPDLEALYKDVHAHPELSMQETRTAGLVADRLRAAGFEVTTGVGKTGVVGLLRNGDGPTVMLRADMDALPIEEMTGLPYASKSQDEGPPGEHGAGGAHVRSRHARNLPHRRDRAVRASAGGMARDFVGGVPTRRGDRGRRSGHDR